MKKNRTSIGILIVEWLLGATFISFGILTSNIVRADASTSVNAAVTVPEACTMTGSGTSHTANIDNGTYRADIGSTTLKVVCNDANGFSIYAIGYTGDQYSGANHTKLVGSNSAIVTGTATSAGNDDVSNWAMKLTTSPSATYPVSLQNGYDAYSLVPDTYTKVATRTSGTDVGTNATGAELTTTYAAYISKTQPADTYTGQVKYTMVHPYNEEPLAPQPATSGCINYFANASNAVGTMGCQPATDGQSKELLASNFSRTGYGFAGWSDSYDYATNPNAKFYGPMETITVPTGTTANGLSLYAVWIESQGSIQDQSKVASVCNSLTTAPTDGTANLTSVSALTDQRDNNTYAIARLADGKCWMIENLRLESTAEHNSDGALAQGYGTSVTYTTYGNFGGLADVESSNFSNSTTANSLYYSLTKSGTASINIGTLDYPAYRMPRYNNLNTSTRATNPTYNFDINMYSYGNYYTWHAAIADLNYNGTNNRSATGTSLCPAGWHLPKGGNKSNEANNELWSLIVDGINGGTKPANYDSSTTPYYTGTPEGSDVSNKLRAYPNNFLYSGYFSTSSAYHRGSSGYYWSSTAKGPWDSYFLGLGSLVYPGTNYDYNKYNGRSIRCTVGA